MTAPRCQPLHGGCPRIDCQQGANGRGPCRRGLKDKLTGWAVSRIFFPNGVVGEGQA